MTKKFEPNKSMNSRFRIFLSLAVLYAFLIFYLSSRSDLGDPKAIFDFMHMESLKNILRFIDHLDLGFLLYPLYIFSKYPDKVEHMVLYAGFGFLLYLTLKYSSNTAFKNHTFAFAIIIGILYGVSDEFHQLFVPGRTASIWDILADGIGIAIVQALILINKRLDFKRKDIKRKGTIYAFDLNIAVLLIIVSTFFILPSLNQTFLQIILALPLLLFLPGYLLISVLFPKRHELGLIERFTMSIGFSVAIVVFDGFALNYTTWGFRPDSIVISLSVYMGLLLILAYYQRWKLRETGYGLSLRNITSFYHTIKSKENETIPEYDLTIEKMLLKTMIIAILLTSAMLVYAKVTTEPEKFTAIYILGTNGKAENYTTEISIGKPNNITIGVENYEHEKVDYNLAVKLGERTLKEQEIVLNHGDKWLDNISFIPQLTPSIAFAGTNRSKLEFQLLKDNKPYRSVHLMVNTSLDSIKFAELPEITNGNMESDKGWIFSGSSPRITGSYDDNITSSRVYAINFFTEEAGSYGTVFQNLTTQGDARAMLSFDVRDSEYSNISYYVFKQALVDSEVVWESGTGGKNSNWEHIEVPVLLSKNNTLAFRVYCNYKLYYNITVWLDNVQLKPYVAENKINSKTEVIRKNIQKVGEYKFNVRGEPHPLEKVINISGFNFPGFQYNLSENRSLEELNLELSDNNQINQGRATYITRKNGSEIYIMGSRYKILGDMPSNLSRILDAPSNMTLKPGDAWYFGGSYSMVIKLISSTGDSALLELRKAGRVVDSGLIGAAIYGGNYEFITDVGKFPLTVFKAKVDSINEDNVTLSNIELYSDTITSLNPGTIFEDFEVTNISSDAIVFKNTYPFELKDKTIILGGSMQFRVSGNILYPYASGIEPRGMPQSIYSGSWMNITGSNYPGFYLSNDTSYEELHMYFSGNGLVEAGQAVYRSRTYANKLSFLGSIYEMNPNIPGSLSTIAADNKIILYENTSHELGKGFIISYKKVNDTNDTIILTIRRAMTKNQEKLINNMIESRFFGDFYYEMYTGVDNKLKKSNILNIGENFEYWIEYKEDVKHKAIAGKLEAINNSSIELNVREYEIPFQINMGKNIGEFEVDSITNDEIILKNTKPLQFITGEEKTILDGALKIKTSPNEYLAYPMR